MEQATLEEGDRDEQRESLVVHLRPVMAQRRNR